MCKELWIQRYESAIEELMETHDFDPFRPPEHIEALAIEMAEDCSMHID